MATIRLTDGGKEFSLPYSLLKSLAENLPDDPQAAELGNALLDLNIPSITEQMVDKEFLTVEQRDSLWNSGDVDVRRRLLHVTEFLCHLTDEQAREIVELDTVEMLETVAEWSEKLYPGRDGGVRLSGAAADRLINHIRTHENEKIRAALAENPDTPAKFCPPFREYIRNGYSRRWKVWEMISVEDIEALDGQSREILVDLAENVEGITSSEARRAAIEMIVAHPDPEVRLALARNEDAPCFAIEQLAKDTEPEIAGIARGKLEKE